MSKTFMYFMKTGEIRDRDGEWDGDEGYWFEYEVEDERLLDAVCVLVDENYFDNKLNHKNLASFIRDFDIFDELVEGFEEELKEYFAEEALESLE